jgi:hypothetical protein
VAGGDLHIGAEVVSRTALDDQLALANGKYFDNDAGRFSSPHADAINSQKLEEEVEAIEMVLAINQLKVCVRF